ncbi:hypothetical protein [Gracilibacillus dipsosauri]|uniref:DUF8042 domain-containing protein n=1 Tax=Gracilibacillus dipsosauri TaxID=178340 RepID=A0A317L0F2_9BACI|nr:hypothetical protein [Gracilibacillus dipsosauri]PWU69301.1 hypothetical protein DLJ74_04760 [Gracilibacillus dipsosauri]
MENNELISTIVELNNNLIKRANEIATMYANNEINKASERLSFLIEDFSPFIEAVDLYKELFDIDVIEELQDKLQLILNELEEEDYLLISELLLYELLPLLEDIREHFTNGEVG